MDFGQEMRAVCAAVRASVLGCLNTGAFVMRVIQGRTAPPLYVPMVANVCTKVLASLKAKKLVCVRARAHIRDRFVSPAAIPTASTQQDQVTQVLSVFLMIVSQVSMSAMALGSVWRMTVAPGVAHVMGTP